MSRKAKPWFNAQTGWWTVWFDGKRRKLAKGKKNKSAANERFLELQFEASFNPSPSSEQTVASVIDDYLTHASNKLAASTLAIRLPYLQSFAEAHGRLKISKCSPVLMEEWLAAHPEWKSDWTKSGALRNVQVAFNWAVKKRRSIAANPFNGVSHTAGESRRNMTFDEFRALLRASQGVRRKFPWKKLTPGARFRQILVFLWLSGARPSEAAKLKWENVDLDHSVIELKQHKTRSTQKRPKPRIILLHPVVVNLFKSIQRRAEGEHVFLTYRGTPWNKNSLGQRVRRARELAKIPADVKLYGTRHAFGTRAIVNGVDIKTLSTLLGHQTVRMTEHYVKLAGQRGHLADAMLRANGSY